MSYIGLNRQQRRAMLRGKRKMNNRACTIGRWTQPILRYSEKQIEDAKEAGMPSYAIERMYRAVKYIQHR